MSCCQVHIPANANPAAFGCRLILASSFVFQRRAWVHRGPSVLALHIHIMQPSAAFSTHLPRMSENNTSRGRHSLYPSRCQQCGEELPNRKAASNHIAKCISTGTTSLHPVCVGVQQAVSSPSAVHPAEACTAAAVDVDADGSADHPAQPDALSTEGMVGCDDVNLQPADSLLQQVGVYIHLRLLLFNVRRQ